LEITQKTIQSSLRDYSTMKWWGSPISKYDIIIDRKKIGDLIKYSVTPIPPSENLPEIDNALTTTHVNIRALFYGKEPFDPSWTEPYVF
jgi:hypothetical protein